MSPKPFRVEAVLPAPAGPYFLERDSAAFRSLLSKVLKIGQLECNDLWHEGQSTFVRMITKPEFGSWVPKGVAGQLQSSNLEFHDIIEYNPTHIASSPYKIFVRTESPFLKDKLDIQLTLTIEDLDGASCRQVLEGHIHVKMFGVGRIVEGIVKDSLVNTYKKLPEIVRRWQIFREEALRSGDGRQLLLGRPPVGCEVQWIRQEVLHILKEPLPEDGGPSSPMSPLCPEAGASEASQESAMQRRQSTQEQQQQPAPLQQSETKTSPGQVVESAAAQHTAALPQEKQQQRSASRADELAVAQRGYSMALSVTEYYDAREEGGEEEISSAPSARQQQAAPSLAPAPAPVPAPTPATGLPPLPPHSPAEAPAAPRIASAAGLAAALLSRGGHHRRTVSSESATSTDTPTEDGHPRQPSSRRFWRRFNRDYGEWDTYWNTVGMEQEEVEGQLETGGVVSRALHAFAGLLRNSYYSTSILVALFLVRRGWLRVEPDANADTHDEAHRQHAGHRHARSASTSSGASGSSRAGGSGADGVVPRSASSTALASRAQSLARVAQEVRSRMVSGSRAVAAAPRRAMAAAGTTMRQASVTGAKAIFARPKSVGGSRDGSMHGSAHGSHRGIAEPLLPAPGPLPGAAATLAVGGAGVLGAPRHHCKTMSLDAGTAAAARQAAAAALQEQQQGGGGASARMQSLQRRPSDMASAAAMNSMKRREHRVHAPSRLSCFAVCRRPPAVKD